MYRLIASLLIALSLFVSWQGAVASESGINAIFTENEIAIIHDYYKTHDSSSKQAYEKKQAHKKKKGLPPGIAKNLQRGKPLPPGIAKKYLPGDLQGKLPPAPDGYERVALDGKILLIEIATQVVADVLTDVLAG